MFGEKFFSTARFFGLRCSTRRDDERICTCVECEKKNHLYWNVRKDVGHCHHCGETFIRMDLIKSLVAATELDVDDCRLTALAEDRRLPVGALRDYHFGYKNGWYILPVFGTDNRLVSVRRFMLGEPLRWCAGCPSALFGGNWVSDRGRLSEPIYVCEGEWDAIALEWVRREVKGEGVVVAVPGASTLPLNWRFWFHGRDVALLYDNDNPGQTGLRRAAMELNRTAKSLRMLRWPGGLQTGYDVRDFVVDHLPSSRKTRRGEAS